MQIKAMSSRCGNIPDRPDLKVGHLIDESLHVKINRDDPALFRCTERVGKETKSALHMARPGTCGSECVQVRVCVSKYMDVCVKCV